MPQEWVTLLIQLFQTSLLLIFILIFTFFFDVLDLRPQIGSFRFISTFTYAVYFAVRVIFGWLASTLIGASKVVTEPILLALISVMAAITTLQNFAVSIGGQDVANLKTLFDAYKEKMRGEEEERMVSERTASGLAIATEMANRIDLKELRTQCVLTLSSIMEANDASNKVLELEKLASGDSRLLATLLAIQIVASNRDYAVLLLEKIAKH